MPEIVEAVADESSRNIVIFSDDSGQHVRTLIPIFRSFWYNWTTFRQQKY